MRKQLGDVSLLMAAEVPERPFLLRLWPELLRRDLDVERRDHSLVFPSREPEFWGRLILDLGEHPFAERGPWGTRSMRASGRRFPEADSEMQCSA